MIGNPAWFRRRKYGGWGLFPKTWQGWVYIIIAIGLLAVTQVLPISEQVKTIAMLVLAGVLVLDTIHIMIVLPRDERDRLHEALAERNALWVMIAVLVIGVGEQAAASVTRGDFHVDPVIIAALLAAVVAKAATNLYLDRRN